MRFLGSSMQFTKNSIDNDFHSMSVSKITDGVIVPREEEKESGQFDLSQGTDAIVCLVGRI
jgi:hypothetical protein